MDRLLYISAVGASQIEQAQALRAHNLANVATDGFRGEFAQALAYEVEGAGHPARVYGVQQRTGYDFGQGVLNGTGRDLDVAVNGEGFLAVQLPDGREGFTRAGALQVDALGRLTTREGFPVLGSGGPVALPPYETLVIGADGSLTVRAQGQGPENLVQVDRLKLVNPDTAGLDKDALGVFVRRDGLIEPEAADVQVRSGFLESSNVNAVNELTEILSLSRQFELQVRMMRTAESNDEAAASLVRIG